MRIKSYSKSKKDSIIPASWFMFLGLCTSCRYTAEEYTVLRKIENLSYYLY